MARITKTLICTCCKVRKPRSDFHRNTNSRAYSGWRQPCAVCSLKKRSIARRQRLSSATRKERVYRRLHPVQFMLSAARHRAKRLHLKFNIDAADISIPGICPVLGITLKTEGGLADNSPSLDRVTCTAGYIKGNVLVVSAKANRIKSNATPEEIIAAGSFYKKLLADRSKNGKESRNK